MTTNSKDLEHKTIIEKLDGHVLRVTLNRPESHNAFDPQMISELTGCFQAANNNPAARALLLTANGKSFCSGADLNWMKSMAKYSEKENIDDSYKLFELFES